MTTTMKCWQCGGSGQIEKTTRHMLEEGVRRACLQAVPNTTFPGDVFCVGAMACDWSIGLEAK